MDAIESLNRPVDDHRIDTDADFVVIEFNSRPPRLHEHLFS